MKIKSLGYRTDLIFPTFEGQITDRGDYLVIRTPSNPTFYWGNFLLFNHPPGESDFIKWRELFAKEIGTPPEVKHQAFGWDTTKEGKGAVQPFLDSGYYLDHLAVLTAQPDGLTPKSTAGVNIRPLETEKDWVQSIENQVICREPVFSEDGYRVFRQHQVQRYRKMVSRSLGAWFGAFSGDRLVGDLGIFWAEELARYQSVQTHPDFRKRGIASALVYNAAIYALENFKIEILVIVADADSPAERLYKSLGFQFAEYQLGISKSDELSSTTRTPISTS
jgi:GNAT superfamily N-acetyltransferase